MVEKYEQMIINEDVKTRLASGLCTPCRKRWLQHLGKVDYSDAFEKRLNIIIGIATIVLGSRDWGGNMQFEWWRQGVALGLVCSLNWKVWIWLIHV
jgi:hypothetical protein